MDLSPGMPLRTRSAGWWGGRIGRGLFLALLSTFAVQVQAETVTCPANGDAPQQSLRIGSGGDSQPDLLVSGLCRVDDLGDYHYGNVNIVKDGRLVFLEPPQPVDLAKNKTNFWAKSIVIENGGSMEAGLAEHTEIPKAADKDWSPTGQPYGTNGNELNIVLYGADQSQGRPLEVPGTGVACVQDRCGIDQAVWDQGMGKQFPMPGAGQRQDYFYPYHPLDYDTADHSRYFGYKVLALSYGGRLQLRGLKGATGAAAADADPTDSGSSWLRLGDHLKAGDRKVVLSRPVPAGWSKGDRIVVTATDYLPNHSEEFTIAAVDGNTLTVEEPAQWLHNGKAFQLKDRLSKAGAGFKASHAGSPLMDSAETRAGVALLSRSIRIVSGGDTSGQPFDWEPGETKPSADAKSATDLDPTYQFGGQVIFRQGFEKLQIQGVEFRWMGQGGRIGHYPVHFHMARRVPDDTYIKDSSINESMTRWIVLHATQGVTLQRNVGYKSIGHGFYLEDATETDNRLYANIGIFARGGVVGPDNPRNVPGILSQRHPPGDPNVNVQGGDLASRIRSDVLYPTVFWMTNAWNDVVGNMAAGANTCGTCYWMVPAGDNGKMKDMKWSGYARLQQRFPGSSPVKQFHANSCSSAMHALNVVASTSNCGAVDQPADTTIKRIEQVPVSYAPPANADGSADTYFPNMTGFRKPTVCTPSQKLDDPADTCQTVAECDNTDPKTCATSVYDSFTTSFNYAETNFGAIWVRSGWNLVNRLFMSDILNGGIGMISGGDYTRSSVPLGYWAVLSNSVFVGETQPGNGYAAPAGPVYPAGHAKAGQTLCADKAPGEKVGSACIAETGSFAYPLSNWSTNRMINIYDGPFYQYANAFLDIRTQDCSDETTCMWLGNPGVRRVPNPKPGGELLKKGFLPNAAIGWKQPNGFYYPPAFHSADLFFDNVDIRHYLTVPLFHYGTYKTDKEAVNREFVQRGFGLFDAELFNNFTDVDRQTVLNDVDGTLTGFEKTISLNQDPFFAAPVQTAECLSNKEVKPDTACAPAKPLHTPTARTSPYDHVTTAIFPGCAVTDKPANPDVRCGSGVPNDWGGTWSRDCTTGNCVGVRLYRQYLTAGDATANPREWQAWTRDGCDKANAGTAACDKPFIRLAGTSTWQRSALTANNGRYYIDTSRSLEAQMKSDAIIDTRPRAVNVFEGGQTYYLFLLFAKNDPKNREVTRQTYQIFVGEGFDPQTGVKGARVEVPGSITPREMPFPAGWSRKMVAGADGQTKDVLEVTMDFSKLPASINLDPKTSEDTCKPASFCSRSGSTCGCSLKEGDTALLRFGTGLKKTCDQVCSTWAVKDLDYPDGGAIGFSFTLPAGFKADDRNHRPAPMPFPAGGDDPWATTAFSRLKAPAAGDSCAYPANRTPALSGACQPSD